MRYTNILFVVLLVLHSCVDRLNFESADTDGILVVDGLITDQPGPYVVKLFRSSNADDIVNNAVPIFAKQVTIFSNVGESEILVSKGDGIYETQFNGIRGVEGRSYSLRIELIDGTILESTSPQEMKPVAGIDSLYISWESTRPFNGPIEYGFRVFIDTKQLSGENPYMRWRYTGIYQAESFPKARGINDNCKATPDPPPCSGYTYTGTRQFPGDFVYTGECTCCICWVSDHESKPRLNDKLSTDGKYKNIEVGFVPFNQWTFKFRKYMIRVEQMSLSDEAFEFWKIIRDQKEGTTNLFQPAFGTLKSNIRSDNNREVSGIFYASAVKSKVKFITPDDALIPVPELNILENCPFAKECDRAYLNASRIPPLEWK